MGTTRRLTSHRAATFAASIVILAVTAPASAEWTAGVFAGGCTTGDTSLTLVQPASGTSVTFDPVHYRSASFEMPIYYGYRVGAFLAARWLGIEGELIHMKVIADTARVSRAEGTVGGQAVAGRILQMDHHAAGYTVVLKLENDRLTVVPYHAIQRIDLA